MHSAVSFYSLVTDETKLSEIFYLLTYLLYGTVLLEKLTGFQLAEKFPAFYGKRWFIVSKFATADKCGRDVLQHVRSVPYRMIARAAVCKKMTPS